MRHDDDGMGPAASLAVTAPREPMVLVRGACKSFSARTGSVAALLDVDLRIPDGSFFTLLGPSGCGKTTLLRILAGFETLDRGTVLLEGRDVAGEPPHRRPVNIVFQSYALFPHLTVAGNVAFGLKRQGRHHAEIAARTRTMLDLVRLPTMAGRRPAELSGGQQQRVALARALAPGPKLLLLDEPLSALDRSLRHEMQGELKRLQRESGITFLLVTHDQEEALSLSDEIAVMNAGRVLQCGTPSEIHGRPACRFVAEFMGGNVLPGRVAGLDAAFAAIRPEAVELARPGQPGLLDGRLIETTFLGSRTRCLVELDDGTRIQAETAALPVSLGRGDPVGCRLRPGFLVALQDPA